jgi:uncharacterized protein DUF742
MSTESEFFEPDPATGPLPGRQGDDDVARHAGPDQQTFADVLNGFCAGRPARRRGKPDGDSDSASSGNGYPDWFEEQDEEPAEEWPVEEAEPAADPTPEEEAFVRPYAWTSGRTRSESELRVEALVSTTEYAGDEAELSNVEHRLIAQLCRQPRSVVEVASSLAIPLRVAKVLLGDMAEMGLITIHRIAQTDGSASHLALMERVLSGLRRL